MPGYGPIKLPKFGLAASRRAALRLEADGNAFTRRRGFD